MALGGDLGTVLKKMFRIRGETNRINVAERPKEDGLSAVSWGRLKCCCVTTLGECKHPTSVARDRS